MERRRFLASCATGATGGLAGCAGDWTSAGDATSHISSGPAVALDPLAKGFDQPVALAWAGSSLTYVADRPGIIHVVDGTGRREEPLLDLRGRMAPLESWEMGLLGLALHPEFPRDNRLLLRYSAPLDRDQPDGFSHAFVLSSVRVRDDLLGVVPDSETVLLDLPQPGPWHQSGSIAFGPDGSLYVGVGDGGSPRDAVFQGFRDAGPGHARDWYGFNRGGNGQDVTENLLGSVLRIDVDGSSGERPYAIPADNPLVGREGLDEQYAWGFRNPYGISFDGEDLYVADVGNHRYEEVNRVVKGGNYGWNVREGPSCVNANTATHGGLRDDAPDAIDGLLEGTPLGLLDTAVEQFTPPTLPACPEATPAGKPLRDPVVVYPHERDGETIGSAVIGGHVSRDRSVPALDDRYVFGDVLAGRAGRLFAADPTADPPWPIETLEVANGPGGSLGAALLGIGRDHGGDLYALTSRFEDGSGRVLRLVPPT